MKPGYICNFCIATVCLSIGFLVGSADILAPHPIKAQDQELPEETALKVKAALEALELAQGALQADGLYTSATTSMNSFGIISGGLNAVQDLERGTGVDPETFAALYADLATDEVAEHIGKDGLGRLTYKNKIVRIYPLSRLKKMYAARDKISGKDSLE